MASYTFENHTFRMVDRTAGKDIKVPSNMYPLNREAQLFTTETTDTISDAHVREIVNLSLIHISARPDHLDIRRNSDADIRH